MRTLRRSAGRPMPVVSGVHACLRKANKLPSLPMLTQHVSTWSNDMLGEDSEKKETSFENPSTKILRNALKHVNSDG